MTSKSLWWQKSGQRDLLMEADFAFETKEWIKAVIIRIQYASRYFGNKVDRTVTT